MAQCDCHVIKSEFLRGARNGYGAWRVTVELGGYYGTDRTRKNVHGKYRMV